MAAVILARIRQEEASLSSSRTVATPAPADLVERCARAAYEAYHPGENAFDRYNAEGAWTGVAAAVLSVAAAELLGPVTDQEVSHACDEGPLLRWDGNRAVDDAGGLYELHAAHQSEPIEQWYLDLADGTWLYVPSRLTTDAARRAWAERVLTAAIGARWER